MAPFVEHTLRLHHPPLQRLPHHHHARGLVLSGCGYRRADSWGVLLCHTAIVPAVVCSASRARQQTRVFSNSRKYYKANTEPAGEKPPSFLQQGTNILKDAFQKVKHRGSPFRYQEAKHWMLKVLAILEKVAANTDNCSNPQDAKKLLDALVQPITDDLHDLDDAARSSIEKASLKAIWKLLKTAPRDVGTTLHREMSSNKKVWSRMKKILHNPRCDDETRSHAGEILGTDTQEMNHGELS